MFFFFFDKPSQLKEFNIESLSDFIQLLANEGKLYTQFRNEFVHNHQDITEENEESGYKQYITEKEAWIKNDFARYIRRDIKYKKDSVPLFYVFYRGVSDIRFQTIPSVYRNKNFEYENRFINDIRVINPDFVGDKTYIDELSALQHYGCPTRLLDLTSNPLVALYFACEDILDSNKMADGSVLFFLAKEEDVLHSNSDKVLILTALTHLSKTHKEQLFDICDNEIKTKGFDAKLDSKLSARVSVKKLYQEILRVSNFEKEILCVDLLQSFYVQPAYNNLRIRVQSGLFLLNGLCNDVHECELRNEHKIFAKITIPYTAKRKILEELDTIGINKKTLFPEIEDTVKYLKSKYK